jgi:hypothetical protein
MTKRAFFVIGPEGSGTNMLAEAFVSAGCHYNPAHNSHLDDYEFEKMSDPFVFRRSLPHAHRWPDVKNIYEEMKFADCDVQILLILRDWYCTIKSVERRTKPTDIVGHFILKEENMRGALHVISELPELIYISYESFCLHPEFRRWLFVDRLGLEEPTIEIKYANLKYYEKQK